MMIKVDKGIRLVFVKVARLTALAGNALLVAASEVSLLNTVGSRAPGPLTGKFFWQPWNSGMVRRLPGIECEPSGPPRWRRLGA